MVVIIAHKENKFFSRVEEFRAQTNILSYFYGYILLCVFRIIFLIYVVVSIVLRELIDLFLSICSWECKKRRKNVKLVHIMPKIQRKTICIRNKLSFGDYWKYLVWRKSTFLYCLNFKISIHLDKKYKKYTGKIMMT